MSPVSCGLSRPSSLPTSYNFLVCWLLPAHVEIATGSLQRKTPSLSSVFGVPLSSPLVFPSTTGFLHLPPVCCSSPLLFSPLQSGFCSNILQELFSLKPMMICLLTYPKHHVSILIFYDLQAELNFLNNVSSLKTALSWVSVLPPSWWFSPSHHDAFSVFLWASLSCWCFSGSVSGPLSALFLSCLPGGSPPLPWLKSVSLQEHSPQL